MRRLRIFLWARNLAKSHSQVEPDSLSSEPTHFAPTLPRPPGYLMSEEHSLQNGSGIFRLSRPFTPPHSSGAVRGPAVQGPVGHRQRTSQSTEAVWPWNRLCGLRQPARVHCPGALLKEGLKIAFDDVETHRYLMWLISGTPQILQKTKVDVRSRSRPGSGINQLCDFS